MAALADSRIGTELAGYRIEELIGRGGMGVVYRARDLALDRDVALKLLAPHLADDVSFRERFLKESRVAASLEHPNVVPIHDAGEIDGQLYIVMRLVEGSDLKKVLSEGPLEPARAVRVLEQVAGALDAAHARGLVHRDVKPSNVLLDEREHVYLADFGLSRRLGEAATDVGAANSLGTIDYVAPEQVRGDQVDGRADLYSLGCLLYESLAGEPPFRRPSEAAVLYAHLEEEPPAPSGLEDVMGKALAKDPDDRYPTCAELVAAARSAFGLEPRRARWPLAISTVGLALIGAALIAFLLTRGGSAGPATTGRLIRIDPAMNQVEQTIAVGNDPVAVAAEEGGVWVGNHDDGTVWRVDPTGKTPVLTAPAHGKPADLTVAAGNVYVSNGPQDANIALLKASTGQQDNVVNLSTGQGFLGSAHVALGPSGIWIATADRRVGRYVSDRGFVSHALLPQPRDERANAYFSGLAVTRAATWVIGDPNDPTLWRIDTATGHRVATIRLPFAPKDVAAGAGAVWVTSQLADTVSRIDPATNRVTATIPVGRGAAGVAVGAGSVWVANAIDGTVSRIDPRTLRVIGTVEVEGMPDEVAVRAGSVWVTARTNPDAGLARDQNELRIGVLAACEGSFGFAYAPSLAGAELPLIERGGELRTEEPIGGVEGVTVAGRRVRLFFGCGDDSPEMALSETRRLVEQGGVDVLIGPTQLPESFPVRDYARRHPEVTFLSGSASGQALTLHDPARNLFRFSLDGAQGMAGLGRYAYEQLGWRSVVTVSNTEAFAYTQVAGFVAEFCALGGRIPKRIWVPIPEPGDMSRYLAQVPDGADGFLMAGSTGTTAAFAERLPQLRGNLARKMVGGIFLPFAGGALGRRLDGAIFAMPIPAYYGVRAPAGRWNDYLSEYARTFPKFADTAGFTFPVMYRNAMAAVLQALEAVGGDLSGGQRRFQAALGKVDIDGPSGNIRLDRSRQAIGSNYLSRIRKGPKGPLANAEAFAIIPNVDQSFGGYFKPGDPPPGRTSPPCKHGNPPPWAR